MLARRLIAPAVKSVSHMAPKVSRPMSTILENKERAEETRYIKAVETAREAEMRKNLERILALEASHEEKQELVELLSDKKEEKKGVLAYLGDWKFAIPAGLFLGIPAVLNESIIVDAELQLTACFILFCSTMYTQVGPMIAKQLDDHKKSIVNDLKGLDDVFTSEAKRLIKENETHLDTVQDHKEYYALVDSMATLDAQNRNNKAEHDYREQILKKLDALHVLEENATAAIRARTVNTVKTEVAELFANDKKAKENALNAAIAVLAQGAGAKLGKDVVGEAFSQSLSAYKEKYAKSDPKTDSILVKLEKDIEAIAVAPTMAAVSAKKNVHPLA
jgi:hypothetical protein